MKQRALAPSPEGNHSAPIIVIEKRALIRESLALCLRKEFSCPVFSFSDVDSWQKASSGAGASSFWLARGRAITKRFMRLALWKSALT